MGTSSKTTEARWNRRGINRTFRGFFSGVISPTKSRICGYKDEEIKDFKPLKRKGYPVKNFRYYFILQPRLTAEVRERRSLSESETYFLNRLKLVS